MNQPTDLPAVFRRAAEIIKTGGHHKGGFYERGAYCAVGALWAAGDPCGNLPGEDQVSALAAEATAFLSRRVPSPVDDEEPVERVAWWNDATARTAAEVVAELELAAAAAELAACHDAELHATHPGHLAEAHDVDAVDSAFAALAPGYPTAVSA